MGGGPASSAPARILAGAGIGTALLQWEPLIGCWRPNAESAHPASAATMMPMMASFAITPHHPRGVMVLRNFFLTDPIDHLNDIAEEPGNQT